MLCMAWAICGEVWEAGLVGGSVPGAHYCRDTLYGQDVATQHASSAAGPGQREKKKVVRSSADQHIQQLSLCGRKKKCESLFGWRQEHSIRRKVMRLACNLALTAFLAWQPRRASRSFGAKRHE